MLNEFIHGGEDYSILSLLAQDATQDIPHLPHNITALDKPIVLVALAECIEHLRDCERVLNQWREYGGTLDAILEELPNAFDSLAVDCQQALTKLEALPTYEQAFADARQAIVDGA